MKNGVAHARFFKLSLAYCLANVVFLLMKTIFAALRYNADPWFWATMGSSFVFVALESWLFFRLLQKRAVLLHAVNSVMEVDDSIYIARTEDGFDVFERGKPVGGRLRFTEEAIKQGLASDKGTNRSGTLMRLFRMSFPDKWLIAAATCCLAIAAVASTSLPHFTGLLL
jgi:hypothetical protein